ncbi:MAG TPA: hypothetical protein VMH89_12000 [Candidatus Acidoferrum sp.]|nr:hypothetical protein [Candidatus Acidoferrum sp.]
MKGNLFFRIASILLVLFALGHTLGFRKIAPEWGVDSLLASLRQVHFNAQGFDRTYYDFYEGFGFFVSVFLLFAALLAWQLGGLSKEVLARIPLITWSLAVCFFAITLLSWKYFFAIPVAFSALITICFLLAAWFTRSSA